MCKMLGDIWDNEDIARAVFTVKVIEKGILGQIDVEFII